MRSRAERGVLNLPTCRNVNRKLIRYVTGHRDSAINMRMRVRSIGKEGTSLQADLTLATPCVGLMIDAHYKIARLRSNFGRVTWHAAKRFRPELAAERNERWNKRPRADFNFTGQAAGM